MILIPTILIGSCVRSFNKIHDDAVKRNASMTEKEKRDEKLKMQLKLEFEKSVKDYYDKN